MKPVLFHLESLWGVTLMQKVCDRLGQNEIVRVGKTLVKF